MGSRGKSIFKDIEFVNDLPEPVSRSKSKSASRSKPVAKRTYSSKSKNKKTNVNGSNQNKNNTFVLHREHGELEATYQERLRFVQETKVQKTKANKNRLSTLSFVKIYLKEGMSYPEEILKELSKCV